MCPGETAQRETAEGVLGNEESFSTGEAWAAWGEGSTCRDLFREAKAVSKELGDPGWGQC